MSSIIVLDSSDEETDSANRKGRLGSVVRNNQPPTQLMARVNPVKTANSAAKKTVNIPSLPNDNFKIHLSSKRALAVTTNEPVTTEATPEKRVRRIKPTTVVRNTDDEWVNRPVGPLISRNGEQRKPNNPPAMLNKSLISNVKNSIRVVKSPITIETQHRTQPRIVESPVPSGGSSISTVTSKSPSNYVRVAWNGKEPKPSSPTIPATVINKNITACVKEQPMVKSQSPPAINKITPTANSVKEPAKGMPLSTPIFSKNSVTIRRVMVSEDRSKEVPGSVAATKLPPNSVTIIEQPKVPCPMNNNNNSTSIRRVTVNSGADAVPQYSVAPIKNFNNLNNSALRITQINPPSNPPSNTNNNRRSTSNPAETMKQTQQQQRQQNQPHLNQQHQQQYQHLPVLKRNVNNAPKIPPNNNNNNSPVLVVNTTTPTSVINPNAATIKRIVTVDLPQTPGSPPVITKSYNTAPTKRSAIDQTKPSMSMSVITKNHTSSLKTVDKKMSPPALPPAGAIMTRPSGLIVTPITCTAQNIQNINSSPLVAPPSKPPSRTIPTTISSTRAASKPPKTTTNRTSEQPITSMAAMFNMYPFMGAPPMMYDMDPTGGAFINPAYLAQRPMRSLEGASYPTMTPPVFNMNFPSFSGGSITPIQSTGTVASPTQQSTGSRSTKSPITSTVTRPTSAIRSPAGFMGLPIDVDQPLPPMSPPVYNMNHPAFSSDMYNLMRSPHTIPSPAYSPVRSTKSPNTTRANPTIEFPTTPTPATTTSSSPVFHIDLDNFVKDPLSYPRNPCNSITSSTFSSNGPIFSVDSPVKNHNQSRSPPGSFKSPNSTITSPAQSTISDGSSICEVQNPPQSTISDGKPQNDKTKQTTEEDQEKEKEKEKQEAKEPLSDEYNTLLDACRGADPSEDMTKLIDTKLIRYYYSVHPDFVKSRGFRKAVLAATERIKKDPDLVYYHLRPVVDEMKARKKSKSVVFNNDEASVASETTSAGNDVEEDETEDDRIRSRQIKQLNKALYILTRKIHRLENEDVDLDDENSTYLVVERYKKRACEIYDKICDLTGESKNALRQVKKPIRFKDTDYPKFNKVVEAFVNRTKEFPDFVDVLRMLEFCNERYNFGLLKEEMSMIAEEAFIKIGKLLQNRRKADLYETVSHFTCDYDDPAANDPTLLAKLSENQKKKTSIGSIIDKYAREQIKRKAESANATGDEESNGTSETCDSDEQSDDDDDEEQSNAHENSDKKSDEDTEKHKKPKKPETSDKSDKSDKLEKLEKSKKSEKSEKLEKSEKSDKPTTNGNKSPQSPTTKPPSTTSPSPSTSAAFRTSPPHAFASPPASPLPRSISPALPVPPSLPTPPLQIPSSPIQTQPLTTSALKIFSVTSLNESVSNAEKVADQLTVPSIDEIIISDEDL